MQAFERLAQQTKAKVQFEHFPTQMALLADAAALFYLVNPNEFMFPGDDTHVVRVATVMHACHLQRSN